MTLRKKALVAIGVTFACLIAVLYAISRTILLTSFAELEERNVRQTTERVKSALLDEISNLDTLLFDWSAWDDTYAFVEDADQAYILSNLVDETFISLRLNFMLFVNTSGQVVFGKGFDLQGEKEMPPPPELQDHLAKSGPLLRHSDPESGIMGILLISKGPLLIASRPILTSEEQGPIRGTLIMGRFLDATAVERLSQITHASLSLRPFDDPQMPPDFATVRASLSEEKPFPVRSLGPKAVAGYVLLEDIYGEPSLIMRVDMSREIYAQGQSSMFYFISALLVAGLFFGGATLLLLEKAVLSPLTQLSTAVSDVGIKGDLAARVPVMGEDELSHLAGTINKMLEALENSQHELQESEERYRLLFNTGHDLVFVTEVTNEGMPGKIIEVNEEVCQRLGYTREELLNSSLLNLIAADQREDIPALAQRFLTGKRILFETVGIAQDGTRIPFEISAHLFDLHGRPAVLSIARDITERKQVEAELSQHVQEQETIFAIGQLVSSSLQIDEVLQRVTEQMVRLVDAASCAISDWDSETGVLTVQAEYVRPEYVDPNDPVNDMGQSYLVADYPATAAALRDGKPFVVYVDDLGADPAECELLQLYKWRAVAGIPLIVQDRIIGLAEVYLIDQERSFDVHDLRLLQALANQVAVAIDNARLFSAVLASEAAMRDLSLHLINVQEQERRYIAQELHDELGQLLTAAKINIDLVQRKLLPQAELAADFFAPLCSRLEEAAALTDKVLTNVRAITVELRPTLLDDMGIVPTLRWYLGRFATRACIQAQLTAPELPARLRPEIETTIYRGVQEALTNVTRYAQASQVQVHLAVVDGAVITTVEDDGRGFDAAAWAKRPSEQQTLGLTGIQERAMLLGGRATIVSQPGQGTRIEIALPAQFRSEEA